MTRFHKIQRFSSIIPFYSSFFVFFVTMIELKRYNASKKLWLYFGLTFFLSGISVFLLNNVIMTGQHLLLNYIASGLLLAISNIICVELQIKSISEITVKPKPLAIQPVVLLIVAIIVLIVGMVMVLATYFIPSVDIADQNGDADNTLAVISLDEILSTGNNFSAVKIRSSYSGNKTNVNGKLKDYDFDEHIFSCQKISGIKTLLATNVSHESIALEIASTIEAGNLEIIIVIDGVYYDHVETNKSDLIVLDNIANKDVVVKMAAESAETRISISRKLK